MVMSSVLQPTAAPKAFGFLYDWNLDDGNGAITIEGSSLDNTGNDMSFIGRTAEIGRIGSFAETGVVLRGGTITLTATNNISFKYYCRIYGEGNGSTINLQATNLTLSDQSKIENSVN